MTKIPGFPSGLARQLVRDPNQPALPAHLVNSPLGAIAYAGAQAGYARVNAWWKTRRTWTVTVSGDDELESATWIRDALWGLEVSGGTRASAGSRSGS